MLGLPRTRNEHSYLYGFRQLGFVNRVCCVRFFAGLVTVHVSPVSPSLNKEGNASVRETSVPEGDHA